MKKIIFLFLLTATFSYKNFAQDLSQLQKDSIIADLYSDEFSKLNGAVQNISFYKIYEALPIIKNEIWKKDIEGRLLFIEAMLGLQDEDTRDFAIRLFDSLETNIYSEVDTISTKLGLLFLLFQAKDFSKINYLYYNTLTLNNNSDNYLTIDLWNLLLDVPEYEFIAKSKLIYFMKESTKSDNRSRAFSWLSMKYREEILPLMLNRFREETDFSIKWEIIYNYLPYGDFEVVSEFIKQNLIIENDETIKRALLYYLLDSLKSPSNYNFIMSWISDESSDLKMKKVAKIKEMVMPSKPYYFPGYTNIDVIIDSTISFLNQAAFYSWIGDNEFVSLLNSILSTSKVKYTSGENVSCTIEVKRFQNFITNVYADSLNPDPRFVTAEGWKFLYWNAQYILDRLPAIPYEEPGLKIKLINSSGNLLTGGSLQY